MKSLIILALCLFTSTIFFGGCATFNQIGTDERINYKKPSDIMIEKTANEDAVFTQREAVDALVDVEMIKIVTGQKEGSCQLAEDGQYGLFGLIYNSNTSLPLNVRIIKKSNNFENNFYLNPREKKEGWLMPGLYKVILSQAGKPDIIDDNYEASIKKLTTIGNNRYHFFFKGLDW